MIGGSVAQPSSGAAHCGARDLPGQHLVLFAATERVFGLTLQAGLGVDCT